MRVVLSDRGDCDDAKGWSHFIQNEAEEADPAWDPFDTESVDWQEIGTSSPPALTRMIA